MTGAVINMQNKTIFEPVILMGFLQLSTIKEVLRLIIASHSCMYLYIHIYKKLITDESAQL